MQSALKVEHKPMSWPAYTHRFAEPKVAELDVALDVQQQVVRLYVPEGGGAARGTHTYISSQVFLRGGGAGCHQAQIVAQHQIPIGYRHCLLA
jgi:hypothetical protein